MIRTLGRVARVIEPLCMPRCIPGFVKNDWMFKMLRLMPIVTG